MKNNIFGSKYKKFNRILIYVVLPLIIFFFALFLRLYFFTGFILGDDIEEFNVVIHYLDHGPNLKYAAHLSFSRWIPNIISFLLFGVSEISFFLPTWILSSSMAVIGYYILIYWRYQSNQSFLAALFMASAPFEILIGIVHANDLIFSWIIAITLYIFIISKKKPITQGIIVAFLLWLAFYTKIWVVYFFPALGMYYLYHIYKHGKWQGLASFSFASIFLHGITSIVWKITTGTFIPFVYLHSASYPVSAESMPWLLQLYPKMILFGSEFGTTLFGLIPYVLTGLLILKVVLSRTVKRYKKLLRFDKLDIYLFAYYTSFFILLNFFPNTFQFDQYYSATRIFRYLYPISFPMVLHIAKIIIDFGKIKFRLRTTKALRESVIGKYHIMLIFLLLISVNIYQANEATKPGQIYRENLLSIVKDIREQAPPQLLSESWINFFLREIYLKEERDKINIIPIYNIYDAKEYEKWLKENQYNLTEGSMLVTGIGNYVHYGCHSCGFRLNQFNGKLDPGWKLFKEYGNLSYLPVPEKAKLWVWEP